MDGGSAGTAGASSGTSATTVNGLALRLDFDLDALSAELVGVVAHAGGPDGGVHREDELARRRCACCNQMWRHLRRQQSANLTRKVAPAPGLGGNGTELPIREKSGKRPRRLQRWFGRHISETDVNVLGQKACGNTGLPSSLAFSKKANRLKGRDAKPPVYGFVPKTAGLPNVILRNKLY